MSRRKAADSIQPYSGCWRRSRFAAASNVPRSAASSAAATRSIAMAVRAVCATPTCGEAQQASAIAAAHAALDRIMASPARGMRPTIAARK